jgi:hypothetical protein
VVRGLILSTPSRTVCAGKNTALQCSFPGGGCGPSGVNVLVAFFTDHEDLEFTHRHQMRV